MAADPNPGGLPWMDDGFGGILYYNGWQCHIEQCKGINPISDKGVAWNNKIPELCKDCQYPRCDLCFNVSDIGWRLQHCDSSKIDESEIEWEVAQEDTQWEDEPQRRHFGWENQKIRMAQIPEGLLTQILQTDDSGCYPCRFKDLLPCNYASSIRRVAVRHSMCHISDSYLKAENSKVFEL